MGSDPIYCRNRRRILAAASLALLCWTVSWAHAGEADSPVGLWKTIDDRSGKARSLVRIYEEGGRLFGRIERGLDPREEHRVCDKCSDERQGKPLKNMVILRNLKADGDEWADGDILDPDNGTVYRCKIRLDGGGRRLVVRGFVGFAVFGRSQIWERE